MNEELSYKIGSIDIVRWIEGHSYEDSSGQTYYSGAESPSLEDAELCVSNPRSIVNYAHAEEIAKARYDIEQSGVEVTVSSGTHRFDTTRENRSMWLAIQLQALANPDMTQIWKTLDGEFVALTAADILTACTAVYVHVAKCFAAEAVALTMHSIPMNDLNQTLSDLVKS